MRHQFTNFFVVNKNVNFVQTGDFVKKKIPVVAMSKRSSHSHHYSDNKKRKHDDYYDGNHQSHHSSSSTNDDRIRDIEKFESRHSSRYEDGMFASLISRSSQILIC